MIADEYVPDEGEVRNLYVNHCDPAAIRDGDFNAEFDRFLARVRRDAWDACYRQMVTAPARGVTVIEKSNPYAPERRVSP